MGSQFGHSCDAILDLELPEPDTLRNFVEEKYDTNPRDSDSDGDLIDDLVEISTHLVDLESFCGRPTFGTLTLPAPHLRAFASVIQVFSFFKDGIDETLPFLFKSSLLIFHHCLDPFGSDISFSFKR